MRSLVTVHSMQSCVVQFSENMHYLSFTEIFARGAALCMLAVIVVNEVLNEVLNR